MGTRRPRTALEAIFWRRFLLSAWPWRSAAYACTTLPVACTAAFSLGLLALPWLALAGDGLHGRYQPAGRSLLLLSLGGVLLVALGPLVALAVAPVERARLSMVWHSAQEPGPRPPHAPGLWAWLRARYVNAATWRALAYTIALATVVPVLYGCLASLLLLAGVFLSSLGLVGGDDGTVAMGLGQVSTAKEALPYALAGLMILLAAPYLLTLAAGGHAAMAAALLRTDSAQQLQTRLVEVTRSRARLVSAFEAERRRIERDLHDGAQQRLISLTLQLGLARHDLPGDSASARSVADAHDQAKHLMVELRELIHGIRPQILADSGLTAALRDLADQSPIPVRMESDLPGRLPDHVESTAYFAVSEALANALKHSGAGAITITARLRRELLVMEVSDDGHGGADPRGGTGLTGLADRVAVLDGRLWLSSPPGGPTSLRVELPCA